MSKTTFSHASYDSAGAFSGPHYDASAHNYGYDRSSDHPDDPSNDIFGNNDSLSSYMGCRKKPGLLSSSGQLAVGAQALALGNRQDWMQGFRTTGVQGEHFFGTQAKAAISCFTGQEMNSAQGRQRAGATFTLTAPQIPQAHVRFSVDRNPAILADYGQAALPALANMPALTAFVAGPGNVSISCDTRLPSFVPLFARAEARLSQTAVAYLNPYSSAQMRQRLLQVDGPRRNCRESQFFHQSNALAGQHILGEWVGGRTLPALSANIAVNGGNSDRVLPLPAQLFAGEMLYRECKERLHLSVSADILGAYLNGQAFAIYEQNKSVSVQAQADKSLLYLYTDTHTDSQVSRLGTNIPGPRYLNQSMPLAARFPSEQNRSVSVTQAIKARMSDGASLDENKQRADVAAFANLDTLWGEDGGSTQLHRGTYGWKDCLLVRTWVRQCQRFGRLAQKTADALRAGIARNGLVVEEYSAKFQHKMFFYTSDFPAPIRQMLAKVGLARRVESEHTLSFTWLFGKDQPTEPATTKVVNREKTRLSCDTLLNVDTTVSIRKNKAKQASEADATAAQHQLCIEQKFDCRDVNSNLPRNKKDSINNIIKQIFSAQADQPLSLLNDAMSRYDRSFTMQYQMHVEAIVDGLQSQSEHSQVQAQKFGFCAAQIKTLSQRLSNAKGETLALQHALNQFVQHTRPNLLSTVDDGQKTALHRQTENWQVQAIQFLAALAEPPADDNAKKIPAASAQPFCITASSAAYYGRVLGNAKDKIAELTHYAAPYKTGPKRLDPFARANTLWKASQEIKAVLLAVRDVEQDPLLTPAYRQQIQAQLRETCQQLMQVISLDSMRSSCAKTWRDRRNHLLRGTSELAKKYRMDAERSAYEEEALARLLLDNEEDQLICYNKLISLVALNKEKFATATPVLAGGKDLQKELCVVYAMRDLRAMLGDDNVFIRGSQARMQRVEQEIDALLPDCNYGPDLLRRMTTMLPLASARTDADQAPAAAAA